MCNRYRRGSIDRMHARMGAMARSLPNLGAEMVHPNEKGAVVRLIDGERQIDAMNWGFPLRLRGKSGKLLKPKPVNNARDDRLHTAFWRRWTGQAHRCLIPLKAWAEADGEPGRMTETWYSLPGREMVAAAGLWGDTEEWGRCYTMVMTDSPPALVEVNDRMPVLLRAEDEARWLSEPLDDVRDLIATWRGPIDIDATDRLWKR